MGLFNRIYPLPLWPFFPNLPGVPVVLEQWLSTLLRLNGRAQEIMPAKQGLTTPYTIQGQSSVGYNFLFGANGVTAVDSNTLAGQQLAVSLQSSTAGALNALYVATTHPDPEPDPQGAAMQAAGVPSSLPGTVAGVQGAPQGPPPLTSLSLDQADQFAISWTTFDNIYSEAMKAKMPLYADTLTDADVATAQFWAQLSTEGTAYNLLLLQKVTAQDAAAQLGPGVVLPAAVTAGPGPLFAIDLRLFESCEPQAAAGGTTRFTPATYTLLTQDAATKALTPVAISVAGYQGAGRQVYVRGTATDATWLYALQAAKTSLTVFGIWIGHVYHWHLVTATMQMTMYNSFGANHPVYELLEPQSDYLMAFNNILLVLWRSAAPPTSIATARQFLDLINQYAEGRSFFDDDPLATLARFGVQESDFTLHTPWDQYPVVQQQLAVWRATQTYVASVVAASYPDDAAVAQDQALQNWMSAAGSRFDGNVHGLPALQTVAELTVLLTSVVYRITIHGVSRLLPMANPALSFVANFPPCLQNAVIPAPTDTFSPATLLTYLPNTGTIGEMVRFYYTFGFSVPYEPFIPLGGVAADLYFPEPATGARNSALVAFRQDISTFITTYYPYDPSQLNQWPLNIET